jgi:hypothetical protein
MFFGQLQIGFSINIHVSMFKVVLDSIFIVSHPLPQANVGR